MGTELLTAAAMVEVKRANGTLWDGLGSSDGPGFARWTLTAATSAFESVLGKLRSGGTGAETSPAGAAGD